jgi:hypothetical protein
MIELLKPRFVSEGLRYHLDRKIPLTENVYRYSSDKYLELYNECRTLLKEGYLYAEGLDLEILEDTDLGEYDLFEGKKVPLDLPMINEAVYRGQNVILDRPQKIKDTTKFFVFVRNPRTKRVNKVRFGSGLGGWMHLPTEMHNPETRSKMSEKMKCPQRFDKMTAVYWTCRLPQFWYWLGGMQNFSGFW